MVASRLSCRANDPVGATYCYWGNLKAEHDYSCAQRKASKESLQGVHEQIVPRKDARKSKSETRKDKGFAVVSSLINFPLIKLTSR